MVNFVKAFNMKMDLRMGNGTTDRPADGISINFARSAGPGVDGDPMLADLEGGSATQKQCRDLAAAAETGTAQAWLFPLIPGRVTPFLTGPTSKV